MKITFLNFNFVIILKVIWFADKSQKYTDNSNQ